MAKRKKKLQAKQQEETLVDIVEARDQAQDFFEQNQNYILGGLLAAVLVFGGIFAYRNFYQAPRQQTAMNEMFQAERQFERDSFALALTNPGGGNMGFLDVMEEYSGTNAANLANYYAGISYLNLGKFDVAIEYLEDYSPAGNVTPTMKYGALGDAYSEKENFDKALSLYKKAASATKNDLLTPYYLKKAGMLSEKLGKTADALANYKKIKAEYPDSPDGRDIDKYIARLNG
ncbi:MAG: tetratricopeptide repeat protein [Bacteroidota bacterium]